MGTTSSTRFLLLVFLLVKWERGAYSFFYEFEGTKYAPKGKGKKTLRISAEASARATQCNSNGHDDHRTPVAPIEKIQRTIQLKQTALQSYCIGNDFVYSLFITRFLTRKMGTRRYSFFYELEGAKYAPKGKRGEKKNRISAEASAQATQCNPKGHEDHRTPVSALEKIQRTSQLKQTALQSNCNSVRRS
jgi:hypothetical protein